MEWIERVALHEAAHAVKLLEIAEGLRTGGDA
jgi:hypothetical protein